MGGFQMGKKKIVVALGHRALGATLPEQKEATRRTAKVIADLVEAGADIVISPQQCTTGRNDPYGNE